jgi:hypothetical protein
MRRDLKMIEAGQALFGAILFLGIGFAGWYVGYKMGAKKALKEIKYFAVGEKK